MCITLAKRSDGNLVIEIRAAYGESQNTPDMCFITVVFHLSDQTEHVRRGSDPIFTQTCMQTHSARKFYPQVGS